MEHTDIVILVGSSCAGKSTLENKLIHEVGYRPVSVHTTRPPREDDPSHYHYYSHDYNMPTDMLYTLLSNEDTVYGYSINTNDRTTPFIVSFINSRDAVDFGNVLIRKYNYKVTIINLIADNDDIIACFKERGYRDETIKKRMEISNIYSAGRTILRDQAYTIITTDYTFIKNDMLQHNEVVVDK